eukprot:7702180-Alexandrium_andersonii.AAC.1
MAGLALAAGVGRGGARGEIGAERRAPFAQARSSPMEFWLPRVWTREALADLAAEVARVRLLSANTAAHLG